MVKTHEWDRRLAQRADIVLTCHRDLRAVARSLAAMGWLWGLDIPGASPLQHVGKIVRLYGQWSAVAAVDLRYEEMTADMNRATGQVAAALELPASPAGIAGVAREVAGMRAPLAESGCAFDPVTLMYPAHRHEGANGDPLPAGLEEEIHRRFYGWQAAHGYGDSEPARPAYASAPGPFRPRLAP